MAGVETTGGVLLFTASRHASLHERYFPFGDNDHIKLDFGWRAFKYDSSMLIRPLETSELTISIGAGVSF